MNGSIIISTQRWCLRDVFVSFFAQYRVNAVCCSYQVLPESRWETGRVGVSSEGAVGGGSPTFANRAVLMGM